MDEVKSGWQDSKEINTVLYDPGKITVDEMAAALKKANTYQGMAGDSRIK